MTKKKQLPEIFMIILICFLETGNIIKSETWMLINLARGEGAGSRCCFKQQTIVSRQ